MLRIAKIGKCSVGIPLGIYWKILTPNSFCKENSLLSLKVVAAAPHLSFYPNSPPLATSPFNLLFIFLSSILVINPLQLVSVSRQYKPPLLSSRHYLQRFILLTISSNQNKKTKKKQTEKKCISFFSCLLVILQDFEHLVYDLCSLCSTSG